MTSLKTRDYSDITEKLFGSLGIAEAGRDEHLYPDYTKLHDPMLLPDMEKARDRVIKAIKENEHIVVFSDYDADGIPGAVVLKDFFLRIKYENVSFYIPHRHDEGFGLNIGAIDECSERGAKLIITIDCGTADAKEIAYAGEKGLDVIVTDHHESAVLPKAYAIVNPKRKDSKYPFKEICGSAVAFKLVQAILAKDNFGLKDGIEKWSLDMVGIATLSDMVPLVGENRILASFGLQVLRKSPRPGLASLFKKLAMNQQYLTEDDIAFMITPRINAASRMGSPEDAFKLLSTTDMREAEMLATHLEKINKERKGVVAALVKDAKSHLAMRTEISEVIVIGNPEWRPSLLGLVANSLVEEYSRPVFVWGRDGDGTLKGSCRGDGSVDLYNLMTGASNCFIEFGGHSGAGGFSITLEGVTSLETALSEAYKKCEKLVSVEASGAIELGVSDVSEKLWQAISAFAPFGTGNPKPIFKIVSSLKSAKTFGKDGNHLEVVITDGGKDVKAIAFFSTPETFGISPESQGREVSLFGNLEKSYFMNRPQLRLRIVDIIHT